jgi:hypothetical protein
MNPALYQLSYAAAGAGDFTYSGPSDKGEAGTARIRVLLNGLRPIRRQDQDWNLGILNQLDRDVAGQ